MVSYSTSDFKPGLKILIDGEPCEIIEDEFVKPGKGQAFSKVKFRTEDLWLHPFARELGCKY